MDGGQVPVQTGAGEAGFWRLYEASLRDVYAFLARRCDQHTAEDLTQEVFLELARRARGGDDLGSITTGWLISVARSRLIDHFRSQQRRERKLRLVWSEPSPEPGDGRPEDGGMEDATERALRTLTEDERRALLLHHLDGLSIPDVAAVVGRSVRGTESLLARARRKFRNTYGEVAR